MSLIYQSLKKLQSETASGPEPGEFQPADGAGRRTWLRHLLWLLPGALVLAAGAYAAWSAGQPGQESTAPESAALLKKESRSAPSAAANGSRNDTAAKQPQSPGSQEAAPAGTDPAAHVKKPPRLLHFTCRGNGTRTRLGLEFDRRPAVPKTSWEEKEQALEVAFPRAVTGEEGSLRERAAKKGTDLSLLSRQPLRLRLRAPDLKEHSAFTLPGSAEYGPRCVLVLRFSPKSRENPPSDSGASTRAKREEPGDASGSGSRAEEKKDTAKEPRGNAEQRSGDSKGSGSLEVASSTSAQRRPERTEIGPSSAGQHASGEKGGRSNQRLLRSPHKDQKSIERCTRTAKGLIAERRYRRALQALQMDNPPRIGDHPRYYALAAYSNRKLGRHRNAARIYRRLAEAEPERGTWWMGLGLCLERLDRNAPALRAYERALSASGLTDEVRAFVRKRKERLD